MKPVYFEKLNLLVFKDSFNEERKMVNVVYFFLNFEGLSPNRNETGLDRKI